MKDKTAKRLKEKRRALRQAERDREVQAIVDNLNSHTKEHGIKKKYKNADVYRICKQLSYELTVETTMYCLLVTMYRLHCEYGWGRIRLMRYADRVHRILVAVGNDERSIDKLMEEVNDETGIDIMAVFNGYKPFGGVKQTDEKKQRMVCVLERVPVWLTVCMYVLYYYYGYKHKRISRMVDNVKAELIPAIEGGTVMQYIDRIREECRLDIQMNGIIQPVRR